MSACFTDSDGELICSGKIGWPNAVQAMRAVQRTLKRKGGRMSGKKLLKPFRCKHCGLFHIGRDVADLRAWGRSERFIERYKRK